MDSIGASTMDQTVATSAEQQYFASQLGMMKHQSRLAQEAATQERQRKQIQQQTLSGRHAGGLDYDFSQSPKNQSSAEEDTAEPEEELDQSASLKQAKAMAKKQQSTSKPSTMDKAGTPLRILTSGALRSYWRYLIPSYGVSIIGINLHGFMSLIMGHSFFAKYGHEWVEVVKNKARHDPVAYKAAVALGDKLGVLEKMLIFSLDFIVLSAIFLALVILVVVTMALFQPWTAAWTFLSWLYDMVF